MPHKILTIFKYIFLIPIIYLFIFEVVLRILIIVFTLNSDIIFYGLNKNISINLHSIRKGEFLIVNDENILRKEPIEFSMNKNQLWVCGGSTSNNGFCDSKNLSWVDLVKIDLEKKNFSKNGINTSSSIILLKNEIENDKIPKIIIWANKVNEILHSKRAGNPKNIFFYKVKAFKNSLKNNLVFFYFFDEILVRSFDKMGINVRQEKNKLTDEDYSQSAEIYKKNTQDAIEIAKKYNVNRFYIVSLFNRSNLNGLETTFYDYYLKQVETLEAKYDFVYFIDTKNYLRIDDKEKILFCDIMHQNYEGKLVTARIISEYIND